MDPPPEGCTQRTTLLGARYLRIHYSADPAKNEPWAKAERAKSPQREWEREMEMNENVYDGEPVFPEYREDRHCPMADEALPILPNATYVGGWDCGQTLHPAFVLLQLTRTGQIHAILEVIPPAPEPMEKFAPRVLRALTVRLPALWDEVRHFGDATVSSRSGSTGDTAQGIAKRHGVSIKPISNEWQLRYSAVTWALQDSLDESRARFVVDGLHCPLLRDGLRGAYRFEDTPKGEGTGAGRVLAMPVKDSYSHVQDALQYAMVAARKRLTSVPTGSRRFL